MRKNWKAGEQIKHLGSRIPATIRNGGTDQGGRHFQGIQTAAASPGQSIASYTLRQILPKMERNAKRQGNGHTEQKNATRGKAEGKTGANLGISCKSILVKVYYTLRQTIRGREIPGTPIRAKCTCKSLLHKGGRYSKIYLESRNRSGTEPSGHALQSESLLVRVYYTMQQSGKAWGQMRHQLPSVRKSCGGYMGASPGAEAERSETAAGSRGTGKRNALQSKSLLVRVYYTKRQSITCYAYKYL
jgi:hypothetical protein